MRAGWQMAGRSSPRSYADSRVKRPPRRYYELTDAGKIELGAVIAEARRDTRFRALAATQMAGIFT